MIALESNRQTYFNSITSPSVNSKISGAKQKRGANNSTILDVCDDILIRGAKMSAVGTGASIAKFDEMRPLKKRKAHFVT